MEDGIIDTEIRKVKNVEVLYTKKIHHQQHI